MPESNDVLLSLCETLAGDLEENFQKVTIGETDYPLTIRREDNPLLVLDEDYAAPADPEILVFDLAEDLKTEGEGYTVEEFEIGLIVHWKIPAADAETAAEKEAAVCSALSALCSGLARYLRGRDDEIGLGLVYDDEAIHCTRVERTPARDLKQWNEQRRFYAELKTNWKRY